MENKNKTSGIRLIRSVILAILMVAGIVSAFLFLVSSVVGQIIFIGLVIIGVIAGLALSIYCHYEEEE